MGGGKIEQKVYSISTLKTYFGVDTSLFEAIEHVNETNVLPQEGL
jgi:hypothetical protein